MAWNPGETFEREKQESKLPFPSGKLKTPLILEKYANLITQTLDEIATTWEDEKMVKEIAEKCGLKVDNMLNFSQWLDCAKQIAKKLE